jgi:hypothetical protein
MTAAPRAAVVFHYREAESATGSHRCDGSLQRGIIRQLSSNNLSKAADSAAFFVVRTYERFARTG